jgi:hypothetical protein
VALLYCEISVCSRLRGDGDGDRDLACRNVLVKIDGKTGFLISLSLSLSLSLVCVCVCVCVWYVLIHSCHCRRVHPEDSGLWPQPVEQDEGQSYPEQRRPPQVVGSWYSARLPHLPPSPPNFIRVTFMCMFVSHVENRGSFMYVCEENGRLELRDHTDRDMDQR